MEQVLLRFPIVAQQLFEELDTENIVNCRNVSRNWQDFIDDQKSYTIRKIGILSKLPEFNWQKIFQNVNHEAVTEFGQMVSKFFQFWPKETKTTPMHLIAMVGNINIGKNYLKSNPNVENNINGAGLTPLHYAASKGNLLICQLIISNVSDKNPRNPRGLTPLHTAAFNGHLSVCELLINNTKDKNPHVSGILQGTPLHFASQKGHYGICELILEHAVIKNPMDDNFTTPLHHAAEIGHDAICQLLMKYVKNKNITNKYGKTPFHLAAQNGHLEVCQTLGVNQVKDLKGDTPFHLAVQNGNLNICKMILEEDAESNQINSTGLTPLHLAAKCGHVDIYKLLIEKVVVKDPRDNLGLSPFHHSASNGHLDLCCLMIQMGCNPYSMDKFGNTALHLATNSDHIKICEIIMDNMNDINPANLKGITPFHHLAKNNQLDLCQMVIGKISDKNPKDNDGNTPLHVAAQSGHMRICELIIGNINNWHWQLTAKNNEGTTPLHEAAKSGHVKICNLLLMNSIQANPRNVFLKTPLQYAAENGHLKTCELLIERTDYEENLYMPIQLAFENVHSEVGVLLLKQISDTKGKSYLLETIMKEYLRVFETVMDSKDLNMCRAFFDSLGINEVNDVLQLLKNEHLKVQKFNPKNFIEKAELIFLQDGWKLLHHAVRLGDLGICNLVIDNIWDKNPEGKSGLTPFHCAAWIGNLEIYNLIRKSLRSTPLKAKHPFDNFERSPLYYADRNGHTQLAKWISTNMHLDIISAKGKNCSHELIFVILHHLFATHISSTMYLISSI